MDCVKPHSLAFLVGDHHEFTTQMASLSYFIGDSVRRRCSYEIYVLLEQSNGRAVRGKKGKRSHCHMSEFVALKSLMTLFHIVLNLFYTARHKLQEILSLKHEEKETEDVEKVESMFGSRTWFSLHFLPVIRVIFKIKVLKTYLSDYFKASLSAACSLSLTRCLTV